MKQSIQQRAGLPYAVCSSKSLVCFHLNDPYNIYIHRSPEDQFSTVNEVFSRSTPTWQDWPLKSSEMFLSVLKWAMVNRKRTGFLTYGAVGWLTLTLSWNWACQASTEAFWCLRGRYVFTSFVSLPLKLAIQQTHANALFNALLIKASYTVEHDGCTSERDPRRYCHLIQHSNDVLIETAKFLFGGEVSLLKRSICLPGSQADFMKHPFFRSG